MVAPPHTGWPESCIVWRHPALPCPRSASADRSRALAFPVLDACWIAVDTFRVCRIAPALDRIVEGR